MKKYAISGDTTEFVQLPPAQHLQALSQWSIDVLFALQPNLAVALSDNNHRIIFTWIIEDLYENTPIGIAAVNTISAQKNPEWIKKWIQAMDEAYTYQKTNPQESKEIAGKGFWFGSGVLPHLTLFHMTTYDTMDQTNMQNYIERLISIGELTKTVRVEDIVYKK
jgi:hypothetical protein